MNKNYLVQMVLDDGDFSVTLMTEQELVHFVNFLDCNPVDRYKVYDVSTLGEINRLYYRGWQPHCLIEFEDEYDNVVVSGYGEDH